MRRLVGAVDGLVSDVRGRETICLRCGGGIVRLLVGAVSSIVVWI